MKQYFEWIPATPDNLPKDSGYVTYIDVGGKFSKCTTFENFKMLATRYPNEYEYLSPVSPLPISGDVIPEVNDHLAGRRATDVQIYEMGHKAGYQLRDREVEKLVEALKFIDGKWYSLTGQHLPIVSEALKPYQSPVKETI